LTIIHIVFDAEVQDSVTLVFCHHDLFDEGEKSVDFEARVLVRSEDESNSSFPVKILKLLAVRLHKV
jgi:hypothetical protein